MTHPIAQTLARGQQRRHAGCDLGLQTGAPGAGWASIEALAGDSDLLRALLKAIGDAIGSERSDVRASIFLESYTWQLVLPLAGALVAEQRVAMPDARDVELRHRSGHTVELRLHPARFATLPADVASTHRDAIAAATQSALAECFQRTLESHFAIVIGALLRVAPRPERALWRTVCDRTAMALLYAGIACGRQGSAERTAHEILGGNPPLDAAPAYVDLPLDDDASRAHLRRGCCLWWRTAAGGYCATCPLRRLRG